MEFYGIAVISPEKVVKKNPEVIIRYVSTQDPEVGFGTDDPSKMKKIRNEILARPELNTTEAVKHEKVYTFVMSMNLGTLQPVGMVYFAKLLHPDLFEDINPREVLQEVLTRYHGSQFDALKHGIFVYPSVE